MEKIKNCPLCGGEVMLCQLSSGYALMPEYSIVCLECGVEFRIKHNPTDNMVQYVYDPAKAARETIEKFNRRAADERNWEEARKI